MKTHMLIAASCIIMMASCKKNSSGSEQTLTVAGIKDIQLQKMVANSVSLNLGVSTSGTVKDTVFLSVSGLPAGVTLNPTTVISGVPDFNTTLTFYDTSSVAATPGTYLVVITLNSSLTTQKTFTFNLTVLAAPILTTAIVGRYENCSVETGVGVDAWTYNYADTVDADANVPNKIYFHNFMHTGLTVYANVTVDSVPQQYLITIPTQQLNDNDSSFVDGNSGVYRNDSIYLVGNSIWGRKSNQVTYYGPAKMGR